MAKSTYIVTCQSGTEWLVRAEDVEDAGASWPEDADPFVRARPTRSNSREAKWLREMGQADLEA